MMKAFIVRVQFTSFQRISSNRLDWRNKLNTLLNTHLITARQWSLKNKYARIWPLVSAARCISLRSPAGSAMHSWLQQLIHNKGGLVFKSKLTVVTVSQPHWRCGSSKDWNILTPLQPTDFSSGATVSLVFSSISWKQEISSHCVHAFLTEPPAGRSFHLFS